VPTLAPRGLVTALRDLGTDAVVDHAVVTPRGVDAEAVRLRDRISRSLGGGAPDVVHAHGWVAAFAAVAACGDRVPVVLTFDEEWGPTPRAAGLARRADALVVQSAAERDAWIGQRVPRDRIRVVPFAAEAADGAPEPGATEVATDACGEPLERVVRSVPRWPAGRRLVVLTQLDRAEQAHVLALATDLGVADRVELNPLLRGAARRLWSRVALVVGARCRGRAGSLVVDAATHGVPAVAVDVGDYRDTIVAGTTGALVPRDAGPGDLGRAVADLLGDPLRLRGYGLAAQLRAAALHEPGAVARRAVDVYEDVHRRVHDGAEADATQTPTAGYRADLVVEHLPVARRIARQYAGRGQNVHDLVQVASLGLVKAARTFDPERGAEFLSYAVPTVLGELRRHFRENAWAMHVPRSLQETALRVQQADEAVRQSLGHEASDSELAHDLDLEMADVVEARQASRIAFSCRSLDAPHGDDAGGRVADSLGCHDIALEWVEDRESLAEALARVPDREREILALRFFGERTQREIAERLGISQMHVSRLLARTLRVLREHVVEGAPLPASWVAPAS
jgi:RNA polymerase sigma-B factor